MNLNINGVYFGNDRVLRFYVSFDEIYAVCCRSGNHIPVRNIDDLKSGNGKPMDRLYTL